MTISLLSFGGNLRKISTIKSNFLPFGGVKNGENALNFGKNVKRTCSSIWLKKVSAGNLHKKIENGFRIQGWGERGVRQENPSRTGFERAVCCLLLNILVSAFCAWKCSDFSINFSKFSQKMGRQFSCCLSDDRFVGWMGLICSSLNFLEKGIKAQFIREHAGISYIFRTTCKKIIRFRIIYSGYLLYHIRIIKKKYLSATRIRTSRKKTSW